MSNFKQYDKVRVTGLPANFKWEPGGLFKRAPQVGDIAYIVEIYKIPEPGYELECSDANGETIWLKAFTTREITLELVA